MAKRLEASQLVPSPCERPPLFCRRPPRQVQPAPEVTLTAQATVRPLRPTSPLCSRCSRLSGFTGLIYESIWSHYLKLFLGHAAYAQTLVLAIFMGGMAIGALTVGRNSLRIRRLLIAYAVVELAIGVFGLPFTPSFSGSSTGASCSNPSLGSPGSVQAFKWTAGCDAHPATVDPPGSHLPTHKWWTRQTGAASDRVSCSHSSTSPTASAPRSAYSSAGSSSSTSLDCPARCSQPAC